jgi:arylsulfatase A
MSKAPHTFLRHRAQVVPADAAGFRIYRYAICVARLACLLLVTALGSIAPAADARPNIVVIVADDLGWADLGCYGSRLHQTPALDRLAREGMRFTQAYAACPVCSPTRASLLTGKYPARLNLTDWLPGRQDMPSQKLLRPDFRHELPLEETTLAELLRTTGYATAAIGKWHLGGAGFEPEQQGFDVNIAGDAAGSPKSYFAPYQQNGKFPPGLENAPAGEYLTDRLTAEAEKFIEKNSDRPFFLYLAHFAPHIPLKAKAELVRKYEALRKPGLPQNNPIYAAMLESLDEGVGRVMQKLEELKLAARTVVVFTSDNGGLATPEGPNTPATSNAPLREGKGYLYEGGLRVPLIVRWPEGIKPDGLCETQVCSIDLVPTLAEICGVVPPTRVDGLSLAPLLSKMGELPARSLFWHYPHYSNQGGRPGGAIRDGDDKLIEFYETGRLELYDLKIDPGESTNLIDRFTDKAARLAAKLRDFRRSVAASEMRPNPDYVPNPQAADGSVTMPAKTADVHGVMVRFEPLPHKNTLGYWVRADDWVSWEFEIAKPGSFRVEILQGCGTGSGGSEVDFSIAGKTLPVIVEETGGFQKFVRREIGTVVIEQPGRHTLTVKPRTKPGAAVMDLREVRLVP